MNIRYELNVFVRGQKLPFFRKEHPTNYIMRSQSRKKAYILELFRETPDW